MDDLSITDGPAASPGNQAVPERCGHVTQEGEVHVGPFLDVRSDGIDRPGPHVRTLDQGVDKALVDSGLAQDADNTKIADLVTQFADPLDPWRRAGVDHGGARGGESELVLEVPVSIVEHDERNAARGLQVDRNVICRAIEAIEERHEVGEVGRGIGGIGFRQHGRHVAGHRLGVRRVKPDVQVDRTVVVTGMVVLMGVIVVTRVVLLVGMVLFVAGVLRVVVVTGMLMVRILLEGASRAESLEDQARSFRQPDHSRLAGKRLDRSGEWRFEPVADEKDDIRLLECRSGRRTDREGVWRGPAYDQKGLTDAGHDGACEGMHRLDGGDDTKPGFGGYRTAKQQD